MSDDWNRLVHVADGTSLGTEPLRRLIDGDLAVLVVKNLLPAQDFATNKERILPLFGRAVTKHYVNGTLTTIGPYLAKHLGDPDTYFTEAQEAKELTSSIGFDLAERTRNGLRDLFGMRRFETAVETDGRRYSESNVRIYADGVDTPLHNDNIMRDAADTGLLLAKLKHQLSVVVCIQECAEGGELVAYRKPWQAADEQHKITGGLGYDEAAVAGVDAHEFKPEAGDVYLLNPTYFHAINRVGGADRVTMGFFFGFFDDDLTDGVTWI
ncbi:hypothetical protein [Lentzea sp. NPDC003310]|uniref:2OG-Fe(II)-dependent halogenase WelO5 family protein n=1 Tax=Lentzea sp. NPDC003310 TaxID=3154447 RepID=UPI00339DBA01